jgi:hypothetical protein
MSFADRVSIEFNKKWPLSLLVGSYEDGWGLSQSKCPGVGIQRKKSQKKDQKKEVN